MVPVAVVAEISEVVLEVEEVAAEVEEAGLAEGKAHCH